MPAATMTSKGQITVPVEVRARLGLRAGAKVDFVVNAQGEVVLRPRTADIRELRGLVPYTGRPVSGEEAASIGLCDAVADDPRKAAVELAAAIAASAPLSVPSIRATLRRSLVSEVSAALDLEADAQAALLDTADFAEGIAASIGKRPPQFAGS